MLTHALLLLCCICGLLSRFAGAETFRMPPCEFKGEAKECELSEASVPTNAKVRPFPAAKGKIILGGGGWNPDFYRQPFVEHLTQVFKKANANNGDIVPVILSAIKDSDAASAAFKSWGNRFQGYVPLRPIYTTAGDYREVSLTSAFKESPIRKRIDRWETRNSKQSSTLTTEETFGPQADYALEPRRMVVSTDPNESENLSVIRSARTAIIIDGGSVGGLAHLEGTKLAEEIRNAYLRGVTIWTTSEGTNAVGAYNASLLWPKNVPAAVTDPTQSRLPLYRPGLGIVPVGVSSHIDSPRLITKYAGCGVTNSVPAKKFHQTIEEYRMSNPYAFLDPIRQMATAPDSVADFPVLGIPDEAAATIENGILHFDSFDPTARMYIFDPRHPLSKDCDYQYLPVSARYDLATGKVLPRLPEKEQNPEPRKGLEKSH